MDKKYLIAGGIGTVVIGIFIFLKMRGGAKKSQESSDAGTTGVADTSYYGGMSPVSGGYSSMDMSGANPAVSGNSGTTETGGGFDISALFTGLKETLKSNSQASVIANQHINDSSILASMLGKNSNVSITHTDTGTTITQAPPVQTKDAYDTIIDQQYQMYLGRDADPSGRAAYRNAMINDPNFSVAKAKDNFLNSEEYHNLHPTVTVNPPK